MRPLFVIARVIAGNPALIGDPDLTISAKSKILLRVCENSGYPLYPAS
jgi:hypothetical protein